MKKNKIFDVVFQCGICNDMGLFVESKLIEPPMWQVGDECSFFVCPKCGADDEYSIITHIETDKVIEEEEELKEWWENIYHHSNKEEVAHLLPGVSWEPPEGIIVETVTAWAVPKSRYPKRDWLTLKEAAEEAGVPKPTLQTWLYREKLFFDQISGWIQKTESTTLIHRSVVKKIEELKKEKAKEKD